MPGSEVEGEAWSPMVMQGPSARPAEPSLTLGPEHQQNWLNQPAEGPGRTCSRGVTLGAETKTVQKQQNTRMDVPHCLEDETSFLSGGRECGGCHFLAELTLACTRS